MDIFESLSSPRLKFVTAVTNPSNGSVRVVFEWKRDVYVVVKTIGPEAKDVFSVKFWNITGSSLEKTMSYWNAKDEIDLSDDEIHRFRMMVSTVIA